MNKAKQASPKKRIVFAEGREPKIIRAAARVLEEGIGIPILVGDPDEIRARIEEIGLNFNPEIRDHYNDPYHDEYVQAFYKLRQRKGVTIDKAHSLLSSRHYF